MSIEDVKRLDEYGIAAWDKHDPDGFVALCDDSIVWRDTSITEPLRGKAAVRQYMQGWFTAFPDMRARRVNPVVTEDAFAAEVEWDGTNKGPLQGPPGTPPIPATGKKVAGRGAYFARVRNGKIVEFHAYPHTAGMLMQLGLMPAPQASPKR